MDDIIVVILTLIIMVAGAIGQAKKKKAQSSSDFNQQPEPDPSIWDFLDENNIRQQNHKEVDIIDEIASNKRRSNDEPLEVVTGSLEYISAGKIFKNEKPLENIDNNLENQTASKLRPEPASNPGANIPGRLKNNLDGFTLKKAVIFSEIIQRKYI